PEAMKFWLISILMCFGRASSARLNLQANFRSGRHTDTSQFRTGASGSRRFDFVWLGVPVRVSHLTSPPRSSGRGMSPGFRSSGFSLLSHLGDGQFGRDVDDRLAPEPGGLGLARVLDPAGLLAVVDCARDRLVTLAGQALDFL